LAIAQSFSAIGEFFGEIFKAVEADKDGKQTGLAILKNMAGENSRDVQKSLVDIDNLHKEICSILKEFSGREVSLFYKVPTIDHLILTINLNSNNILYTSRVS
jgi:hypothetical protein